MNLDLYLEMRMIAVRFVYTSSLSYADLRGYAALFFWLGLLQPLGRCHQTIYFPLITDGIGMCSSHHPSLYGCHKFVEYKQHEDLGA